MAHEARIGSVSSGTLRPKDLLLAFASELESIDDHRYRRLLRKARRVAPDTDDSRNALEDLERALDDHAPPYCYFGAHAGDGADFGYWPDWDAIEADRRDGTLASGNELPADGTAVRQYLHISDHGNAEMYAWDVGNRQWRSLWSVV